MSTVTTSYGRIETFPPTYKFVPTELGQPQLNGERSIAAVVNRPATSSLCLMAPARIGTARILLVPLAVPPTTSSRCLVLCPWMRPPLAPIPRLQDALLQPTSLCNLRLPSQLRLRLPPLLKSPPLPRPPMSTLPWNAIITGRDSEARYKKNGAAMSACSRDATKRGFASLARLRYAEDVKKLAWFLRRLCSVDYLVPSSSSTLFLRLHVRWELVFRGDSSPERILNGRITFKSRYRQRPSKAQDGSYCIQKEGFL